MAGTWLVDQLSRPRADSLVDIRNGTYEDDEWVTARVVDLLSEQFTCVHRKDRIIFAFYKDEGSTWSRRK